MTAEDLRDEAVERVEAHADPTWLDEAYTAIATVCMFRGQGGEFTTDAVWAVLDRAGIESPHEPRAMGPVIRRAVGSHLIEWTGQTRTSTIPHGHRRIVRVYRVL